MADKSTNERNPFLVTTGGGPRPRIAVLLSQLAGARHYLLNAARDLAPEQLDAPVPVCPNSIGELLAHEARHTGQITLIRKHLMPQHDPSFNPYALT